MCGIVGVIDPRLGDGLCPIAELMAESLIHRGPDSSGVWAEPALGLALAHRRLAILDLTPDGAQPMHYGDLSIVFNGEIYNWRELRGELERLGHRFRSRCDTEVLLAACNEWGVAEALPRLRGMFAFAIWDHASHEMWLARDRMGEKPLSYGWIDGAFVFASESRAMRVHPRWRGTLDQEAMAAYLALGWIPAPRTIWSGISKLPPGSWLRLSVRESALDVTGPVQWWSTAAIAAIGRAEPFAGDREEATAELDTLLRSAITEQMIADVPLGAFLSGGIDSSSVVALMQAQSPRPVRTFTIGFREAGFDEARPARRVAAHLGTEHTETYMEGASALAAVPRLSATADEPFGDPSLLPALLVAGLAKHSVTVALSGDGGDELFAGYNRHRWGAGLWPKMQLLPRWLRRSGGDAVNAMPDGFVAAFARSSGRAGPEPVHAVRRFARALGARDPEDMYWRILAQASAPLSLLVNRTAMPSLNLACDGGEPDAVRRMQLADQLSWLPDDCLVKVDRAAMAVSLETRVPLLDHRIVAFAWSLPRDFIIAEGVGKQPLRRLLARYLPSSLSERPKAGFTVPIAAWLAGPLRTWGDDLMTEDNLRQDGVLDPRAVAGLWSRVRAGGGDAHLAWALLSYLSWRETQQ